MDEVTCVRHDGWAEVVLNRPERRNAIDGPLADRLLEALRALNGDDSVRAILLRGAGGALCSGLDLKAFDSEPPPPWRAGFAARWREVHDELIGSAKALVVALERYAINGGAALALAGDVLVCGRGAYLQVGEVQIGMAAPRNVAWIVLRHGEAKAARLALLGDRWDAARLAAEGIADEVVDDDRVLSRAREIAVRLAGFPGDGVARIKTSIRAASARMPAREWFDAAAAHDQLAGAAPVAPARVPPPRG